MEQRIIIRLQFDPVVNVSAWQVVESVLMRFHATHVKLPEPTLSGVATAVIADEASAKSAVAELCQLPDVSVAGLDQLLSMY